MINRKNKNYLSGRAVSHRVSIAKLYLHNCVLYQEKKHRIDFGFLV